MEISGKFICFVCLATILLMLQYYRVSQKEPFNSPMMHLMLNKSKLTNESLQIHLGYESYPGNQSLQTNCRTCAFVTGSGHMERSKQGKTIDSCDCVIRSNDSPTKGFESDVGKRTTFRTVDVRSFKFVTDKLQNDPSLLKDYDSDGVLIMYGFPDEAQVLRRHETIDKAKKKLGNYTVHIMGKTKFNEHFQLYNEYVEDLSKKKNALISNGFTSIYFAHDICEEIHVFGIAYPSYCQEHKDSNVKYHYYPKTSKSLECSIILSRDKQFGSHHFTNEKIGFRKLEKNWNIHFHSPMWPDEAEERKQSIFNIFLRHKG